MEEARTRYVATKDAMNRIRATLVEQGRVRPAAGGVEEFLIDSKALSYGVGAGANSSSRPSSTKTTCARRKTAG